ncbi:hypothetical protein ACFFTK_09735 [Pseudonocardia petroleophila]|uniref:Uncharacterized protein n=1 Tax=Pseudonocardia petroleophila TaxID=37331 RepID=A0A7G7MGP3_9PSEU|nr:hypothetical protein [Pseudonocardia petroleophila]QNG51954.1 hypothetical protein H6H00_28350 [Pseudonocardia petroleophila]
MNPRPVQSGRSGDQPSGDRHNIDVVRVPPRGGGATVAAVWAAAGVAHRWPAISIPAPCLAWRRRR